MRAVRQEGVQWNRLGKEMDEIRVQAAKELKWAGCISVLKTELTEQAV